MTPTRVAAVLIMLMAGILGVFLISARAITYEYDGQNRVTALYLDDGTWIQYTYDANGNRTAKTYYNQFFALMASSGAGGTVSPPSASVIYGANQTFTISPATGYYITDVSVDGASVGVVTSYTFTNVTASHVIQASFAIYTYPITTSVIGGGGSISPSSATVNYGAGQAFAITPSTGYYITNVIVDGSSVGAVAGYTFTNVTAAAYNRGLFCDRHIFYNNVRPRQRRNQPDVGYRGFRRRPDICHYTGPRFCSYRCAGGWSVPGADFELHFHQCFRKPHFVCELHPERTCQEYAHEYNLSESPGRLQRCLERRHYFNPERRAYREF